MIWLLGWVWWLFVPVRKRLAVANYRKAFPDRDPGELRRTVGGVVWGYFELIFGARATIEGLDKIEGPALLLASHTGSWDVCLVSFGACKPTTIFVKTPANPLVAWCRSDTQRMSNEERNEHPHRQMGDRMRRRDR